MALLRWSKDRDFSLETGTVSIRKGSLVAIVGKVGCGKSSLLSCLLGDMVKRRGSVNIDGQIAYIPQDGWILNTTLKENILFGKSMQVRNYERVISASALEQDFSIMAHGDQTEIGENGINLSGGQNNGFP
jgi:ABC-type bacteriocin/lantibiotic exporters, contain an N-terminal double-glycine peptidase domain